METVSYGRSFFRGRLSIDDKDGFYLVFQEGECAKEEANQRAGKGKRRTLHKNLDIT